MQHSQRETILLTIGRGAKTKFILVYTQGTLTNLDYWQDWANELHPYPEGFGELAVKFLTALRAKFPGQV